MKKATIISDSGTIDDHLGSNLPPEIVTDVLYRLPVKSLCRFKCVSPSWKTLISSPHFAQTHLHRAEANHHPLKAILFSCSFDLYSVDFADANPTPKKLERPSFKHMSGSRSLSSCNGLVLVSDKGYVNFLFNPSTSEYKELPAPFPEYSSDDVFYSPGLGYDSYTDDYKVVMPFSIEGRVPNDAAVMVVAVYSLKTNAWRTIQDFPYTPVGCRRVCFNERLHWLCRRTVGLDYSKIVVAFNLADEIFREVQMPASYDHDEFTHHDMVVLEGCLSLLVWSQAGRIDVWMMMEYGLRESWTKFLIVNLGSGRSIVDVLCLSMQDELVLRLWEERFRVIRGSVEDDGERLILYNLIKGTQREVVVPGILTEYVVGDHYIETLVSPNHGGRISETM
ncbi:hypothetical protein RHGRI_004185 [Rhododendron griersonianum]|uniref:F-box domain-containing protein n=1 Tax=Rhododendron griersonianum TaxID=479676 RepID=A0AAV6L7Q5_9ERIC|nr:hypothetical protein RHGRI_004185 [Rhododendron griersonianum]KAG5561083.1 hypothetical protein RHGRI_004185 [Rhododendron griersonianum]